MNDLKFTTAHDYMQSKDVLLTFAKEAGIKANAELSISPQEQHFAELIINECSRLLEDEGMVEVAMMIKQHFSMQ